MDHPIRSRALAPGHIVAGVVLLLLTAAGAHGLVRLASTDAIAVDAARLEIATVRRAPYQNFIPVTASVVPAQTVYLDAIEAGQVTRVMAEEGQQVVAGQPLLEMKNADLQLRLVEAQARLTEQVNTLNQRRLQAEQTHLQLQEQLIGLDRQIVSGERELARYERLLKDQVVALSTVEDLRDELAALRGVRATVLQAQRLNRDLQASQTAQLQASVDAMAGNLAVARDNLQNLVVKAPIAGQLTVFEAEVGEAKSRAQRIGQVDAAGAFKASALVDEFYLGRVAAGQMASVRIGSHEHALRLVKIYPNVRERQFQIDLAFEGTPPPDLRRGQTLQVNLQTSEATEALLVANGPWLTDTGGTWAFVVDGGSARRRDIRVGRRNPRAVEIIGGLAEGERLIVSTYAQMSEFERVDIRGSTEEAL